MIDSRDRLLRRLRVVHLAVSLVTALVLAFVLTRHWPVDARRDEASRARDPSLRPRLRCERGAMKRWLIGLAGLAIVARALGTERIADWIRWADQRLELFSPRGASLYARVAPRLLAPLYRTVADDVAETRAHRVLDVGTGPGVLAIEIARRCPSCEVIGVDLAPEMLATAGARAGEAGVADRVSFQVADASALSLADASIDLAVSTLSLHHWRDPVAVLGELHRVLRPGGQALIYDLRFSYSRRQFAAFAEATPFGGAAVSYATLRGGLPIAMYARYALRRAASSPQPAAA